MTPIKASIVVFTEFQRIHLMLCVFWFQDAGNKDIQTVQALTLTSFYINRCDNCKAIGQLEANKAATIKNRDVAYCGCNKTTTKCLILAQPQDDRSEKWRKLLRLVSSSNHGTRSVNSQNLQQPDRQQHPCPVARFSPWWNLGLHARKPSDHRHRWQMLWSFCWNVALRAGDKRRRAWR